MTLYPDGTGYCHACGTYYPTDQIEHTEQHRKTTGRDMNHGSNRELKAQDAELELSMVQQYCTGHPFRKEIRQDVCHDYGVVYSTGGTGEPDSVLYFYRDEQGVIIDAKKKTPSKQFFAITGKINKSCLFGRHLISPKRRKFIIVTEGEDDTLAVASMYRNINKDYAVVSLQNGANEAGKLDAALRREASFLQEFDCVALCLDQDTPGMATANELAEVLAPHCDVRLVTLPEKDAYDMLHKGRASEFYDCVNTAPPFTPEGIIEGANVELSVLREPSVQGYSLPWPSLQHKTHGLRKGEITLLCAGSGIGKTTIARELAAHCVQTHNLSIGNIYLEEQWKKTAQGYIAIDNNVPLAMLRVNPGMLTPEQWQASHNKLFKSNRLHFFKHFGSVQSDKLMRKANYLATGLGCDFIVLDHITMVLSGLDTHDERKDIDVLMTRLAELVTSTGVGVIAVVHLKRSGRDVSFNAGGEVALTDLRGSSQLEALSFNVWAAERDQQSTSQADILTLRVLKNREWGFTGLADKLFYNHETGRLVPAEL